MCIYLSIMSRVDLIIFPIVCFYQLFESQLSSKNSVSPLLHFLKHCMSVRTLYMSISYCHTAITYVYYIIMYVSFLVFIYRCMYFVMLTFLDSDVICLFCLCSFILLNFCVLELLFFPYYIFTEHKLVFDDYKPTPKPIFSFSFFHTLFFVCIFILSCIEDTQQRSWSHCLSLVTVLHMFFQLRCSPSLFDYLVP